MAKIKKNKQHLLTIFITIAVCALVFGAVWGIALNMALKDKAEVKEDKTEVVAEEKKPEVKKVESELPTLTAQDMTYINYMGEYVDTFKNSMDNLSKNLSNLNYSKSETVHVVQVNLLTIDAILIGYWDNVPSTVEFAESKEMFDTAMKNYKGMVALLQHAIEVQDADEMNSAGDFIDNGNKSYKAGLDSMKFILTKYAK